MKLSAINVIELGSNIIPLGAALRSLTNKRRAALVLIIFISGSLATELITIYLGSRHINNHFVLNIYNVFEFLVLGYYFSTIEISKRWKTMYPIIGGAYIITWIVFKFTLEPVNVPAEYSHTISAGILSCVAVRALCFLIEDEHIILYRDERFWMAIATLFSYFMNIVMYGYINALARMNMQEAIKFWSIHWVVSIVGNFLFALGFVWNRKT